MSYYISPEEKALEVGFKCPQDFFDTSVDEACKLFKLDKQ